MKSYQNITPIFPTQQYLSFIRSMMNSVCGQVQKDELMMNWWQHHLNSWTTHALSCCSSPTDAYQQHREKNRTSWTCRKDLKDEFISWIHSLELIDNNTWTHRHHMHSIVELIQQCTPLAYHEEGTRATPLISSENELISMSSPVEVVKWNCVPNIVYSTLSMEGHGIHKPRVP
jgi:hypothetical protein